MSPSAALRPCAHAGCPALVPSGRCAAHQTAEWRRIERYRGTAKARGYDKDWRRVRYDVLKANPYCVKCQALNPFSTELAREVDHVVPLANGGERLDRANLQPLCRQCHQAKTAGENERRRA